MQGGETVKDLLRLVDFVPHGAQLISSRVRCSAYGRPYLAFFPISSRACEIRLPSLLGLNYELLLNEKLNEVLKGWPESSSANREVQRCQALRFSTSKRIGVTQPAGFTVDVHVSLLSS